MTNRTNIELLHDARATRRNLLSSHNPLCYGSSIRDAVELAADTLRQLAHEAKEGREAA